MWFLWNRSSYSFEICTIVIGTPENFRCTEFGPLNTKESDVLAQNVVFLRNRSSYSFEICTIVIGTPENFSRCTEFGPLNTKESDVLAQNVVSLKQIIIQLWNLYHYDWHDLKTSEVHWVWPSKYKGKWCFSPKCGFSETDHHTALKFVPLWLAHLKMSACTEFGPLNTKESDVLAQNVVSQKQIIIQLWNLYHCDWHTWKLQGALSLAL